MRGIKGYGSILETAGPMPLPLLHPRCDLVLTHPFGVLTRQKMLLRQKSKYLLCRETMATLVPVSALGTTKAVEIVSGSNVMIAKQWHKL